MRSFRSTACCGQLQEVTTLRPERHDASSENKTTRTHSQNQFTFDCLQEERTRSNNNRNSSNNNQPAPRRLLQHNNRLLLLLPLLPLLLLPLRLQTHRLPRVKTRPRLNLRAKPQHRHDKVEVRKKVSADSPRIVPVPPLNLTHTRQI